MFTHPLASRLTAAFALVSAATVIIAAQDIASRDTPQRQPPIRVQTNFVRVDVFPTSDGRPIVDLRAEDFELFEDGKPQRVDTFEHIVITSAGPQAQRREPNTIEASKQLAANPRARVVVVFLDAPHTTIEGTWHIREPLIRLLDRVLGPDDLVGIMTPEMAPQDVTLARKTDVVENGLRKAWPWGYRHTLHEDRREIEYQACYPPTKEEILAGHRISPLAKAMAERRRERISLDALNDLVHYLRDLREERKAILTVSEGWLLYPRNAELMKLRDKEPVPGQDALGVGRGGKIVLGNPNDASYFSKQSCDTDRMRLANSDNPQYFRYIIDEANRANASFYTVDPRGLAAFDTPIGPEKPLPLALDQAHLRGRIENLRTLAEATDGLAVFANNDLDVGLKRIADDLTSYYLLGYYSTNPKMDGTFRRITVKVKRPGTEVRARRGYRAPTEAEVTAAREAASAPVSAEAAAVTSAIDSLARIRPEARFRIHATPASDGAGGASLWVAGELQGIPAADPWARGGTGEIDVTGDGVTASARVTLAAGERAFLTSVRLPKTATGPVTVRARLAGTDPTAARLADSVHVPLSAGTSQPLLFRRGPTTGNRQQPAATFLFSRTERLRIEIPAVGDAKPGTARLLDRAAQPLPIPLTVGERTDAESGRRWFTVDATLAPLGAGDYVIEVTWTTAGQEQKTVTAIRVAR